MFRRIARHPSRPRSPIDLRVGVGALLAAAVLVLAAGPVGSQNPTEDPGPRITAVYTGPVTSANARFVVEGYRDLLGREPDTAGLDFHLARLASGGDRSRWAFTYSLLFSGEGSRGEVARAYDDLLDRAPDGPGSDYWTAHLQGHSVLDLRVLLLASDEYRNRAGATDQGWIEALYADVLGRGTDPSGLAYWLERAGSGIPRPLIAAAIYQSDEALGRRADAHYLEVLSRTPSTAERAGAVATIRRIGERGLRAELLASDEAFEVHLQAALS